MVEKYERIRDLAEALPEGSPLLANIGRKLESVGMSTEAAQAYLRGGDVKAAVDCCVLSNRWDMAVDLAHQFQLPQVEGLLARYVTRLLDQGRTLAAIELYRKANRDLESAKLLASLAAEVAKAKLKPLRAKQFYVLAAIEVERHRKRTMDMSSMASAGATTAGATMAGRTGMGGATMGGGGGGGGGGAGRTQATMATAATLDTLIREDAESQRGADVGGRARTLDAAWQGAEAYHYLMLAQRQLFAGSVAEALVTACRLRLYEDVLDPRDIHSLIALAAYYNGYYGVASRALIRLEHLDSLTAAQRERFADVSFDMFMRTKPADPPQAQEGTRPCPSQACGTRIARHEPACPTCRTTIPACVATGAPLWDATEAGRGGAAGGGAVGTSAAGPTLRCSLCRHKMLAEKVRDRTSCPLCHEALAAGGPQPAATKAGGAAAAGGATVGSTRGR
jgi:WD repeat-containing protein 35